MMELCFLFFQTYFHPVPLVPNPEHEREKNEHRRKETNINLQPTIFFNETTNNSKPRMSNV